MDEDRDDREQFADPGGRRAAEKVGAVLGDDGQTFAAGGLSLGELCDAAGARCSRVGVDYRRFDFADGSSIVACDSGWDYGLEGGCWCWAGADHGQHHEDCEHAA